MNPASLISENYRNSGKFGKIVTKSSKKGDNKDIAHLLLLFCPFQHVDIHKPR